jgi:hypothetical protein
MHVHPVNQVHNHHSHELVCTLVYMSIQSTTTITRTSMCAHSYTCPSSQPLLSLVRACVHTRIHVHPVNHYYHSYERVCTLVCTSIQSTKFTTITRTNLCVNSYTCPSSQLNRLKTLCPPINSFTRQGWTDLVTRARVQRRAEGRSRESRICAHQRWHKPSRSRIGRGSTVCSCAH